ncbi:MAG: pyruvate synthase subunit PorB [Deltaproteobacteria bacterium HGW-Deltaproteobacteria-21]|jgi:pyruvate/2-oxoacid:ferredoxin oxidoreductase beta subunit|nr:MAG: pyruvate synthase subunit PorB [Deltaproteobacteria bacterium HGW-Deltaproteobacteria-21]
MATKKGKLSKVFDYFSDQDPFAPGVSCCAGCPLELALRFMGKVLGRKDMVITGTPGCANPVLTGQNVGAWHTLTSYGTLMTSAASNATGLSRYYRKIGQDATVVCFNGDGCAADIGFQNLSGAAERNEKFIYICYDNEGYMNTGVQRSSTTPAGARTATTPVGPMRRGKPTRRKNLALLMAMHWIPYAATATLSHLEDFAEKLIKAKQKKEEGLSFIHIFCPCPTGWGVPSDIAIELCRTAVRTNYFPLWEAENGIVRITHEVKKPRPVSEYLNLVKKFSHMTPEEQQVVQEGVDFDYAFLTHLAKFKK